MRMSPKRFKNDLKRQLQKDANLFWREYITAKIKQQRLKDYKDMQRKWCRINRFREIDYYSKTRLTKKIPEDQWLQNDITYHQHNFKRDIFAGRFKTI